MRNSSNVSVYEEVLDMVRQGRRADAIRHARKKMYSKEPRGMIMAQSYVDNV